MLDAVLVTRMVVKTLVISSFKILNTPRLFPFPPLAFSSSSANSLTFHGYNVVIAISAAWSNAKAVKRNRNKETDVITCSRFMGATGPLGPPPAAIANANFGDRVRVNVISISGAINAANFLSCAIGDLFRELCEIVFRPVPIVVSLADEILLENVFHNV